ncbi:hypothetical protein OS493_036945 [Desmophyllum pertusum]|uniref:D-isomer specific 2-hydroxyacid dehydrogenase NAD-binding domain-containing protein n=1 Tax=Desmophyllum pertusum TaxID=174260 RepID=A0A9X0D0C9_9CNID|nr:hypothetical protein OS493_036945 [Desmophyllum pertusum]
MASPPLVLRFTFSTRPNPAPAMIVDLASKHYGEHFTLVDQLSVTDLSEIQRENVRGLLLVAEFDIGKLGKETMDLLPNLKVISTPSTGVDYIDVEAATAHGIRVGHSPGHFPSDSVAEFAFGLLLASARSIGYGNKSDPPGQQVTGSTLGIVGLGNIGRAVAERAKGFKMNILYHSRTRKEEMEKYLGLTFCSELKELLEESDFVVLCVPLTSETKNLIASKELGFMKSTATLINVGRGELSIMMI